MSQWLLHIAGRGLLGNGADVYWRGIGVSVSDGCLAMGDELGEGAV